MIWLSPVKGSSGQLWRACNLPHFGSGRPTQGWAGSVITGPSLDPPAPPSPHTPPPRHAPFSSSYSARVGRQAEHHSCGSPICHPLPSTGSSSCGWVSDGCDSPAAPAPLSSWTSCLSHPCFLESPWKVGRSVSWWKISRSVRSFRSGSSGST